ncbi:hypothetical protein J437_LFUL002377 [Ladona fulva]|uniref:Cytochrome c oxidase assembly protein COX11, mitochondrial n=1 Tax=Ladona fulva TaxID=123851 RepID=A0A8K0K7S6_LADFU|nr:hypothetical protein J437_LFUL002377 [Ladona fulva]
MYFYHLKNPSRSSISLINKLWKQNPIAVYDKLPRRTLKTSQFRFSAKESPKRKRDLSGTAYYFAALGVLTVGLSYAAVPLYRMFCQASFQVLILYLCVAAEMLLFYASSYGGTTAVGHDPNKVETMPKITDRSIKVIFNADVGASMRWNFKPQQSEIRVVPGETALAFYTACNPTDSAVIGISTYNVVPFEAGQYFNKIQCFCFEEQLLNPHEEVDMPVFFYIDPEFAKDPKMEFVDTITLSYTFFEAKEGLKLPIPDFIKK